METVTTAENDDITKKIVIQDSSQQRHKLKLCQQQLFRQGSHPPTTTTTAPTQPHPQSVTKTWLPFYPLKKEIANFTKEIMVMSGGAGGKENQAENIHLIQNLNRQNPNFMYEKSKGNNKISLSIHLTISSRMLDLSRVLAFRQVLPLNQHHVQCSWGISVTPKKHCLSSLTVAQQFQSCTISTTCAFVLQPYPTTFKYPSKQQT